MGPINGSAGIRNQRAAGGRWAPETGYGIQFKETIRVDEAIEHMEQFKGDEDGTGGAFSLLDPHAAAVAGSAGEVLVLKPHGSLNWLVPFEDNYKFTNDEPLLLLDGGGQIAYCSEFAIEHITHTRRSSEIAFDAGLFIVPPLDEDSMTQVPSFLVSVQEQSLDALRDADEIVVIGWSMPKSDKVEVKRLSDALASGNRKRRVTAVNFNECVGYFQKLARTCHISENDVIVFNAGFADFADTL